MVNPILTLPTDVTTSGDDVVELDGNTCSVAAGTELTLTVDDGTYFRDDANKFYKDTYTATNADVTLNAFTSTAALDTLNFDENNHTLSFTITTAEQLAAISALDSALGIKFILGADLTAPANFNLHDGAKLTVGTTDAESNFTAGKTRRHGLNKRRDQGLLRHSARGRHCHLHKHQGAHLRRRDLGIERARARG